MTFLSKPRVLLHLEGGVVLLLSLLLYWWVGGNWLLFLLLCLAPDLSALAYMLGVGPGSAAYNLVHNYTLPGILAAYGLLTTNPLALSLSFIWFAHIGGDRLLGYGLKYPTTFKDTHLGRV